MAIVNPKILLTIGDPNGIGPEIILKLFNDKNKIKKYCLKIIGSKKVFNYYSCLLHTKNINASDIIDLPFYNDFKVKKGKINKIAGRMSGDAVRIGTELCLNGEFDAMVTLPISKEALNAGGYKFPGHTEMLTELTNSKSTVMIMYSNKIIVSPITIHIPIKDVSKLLTRKLLREKFITINNTLLNEFKLRKSSLAVLSLNPHCGDGGLIGNEESQTIKPVIDELSNKGMNISGPFPPDAYFANKSYRNYNITVSMYHDQGLIPFKMLSSGNGVNYTGGLKFIRTSPDHGTAFDIVGKGIVNNDSTLAAIKLAYKLVKKK
ncbi:MAG: 4-hydroxythreonine-4-phosphate dehydrogenase PdxA [Bacteroidetes bacterium]|nr:4-hydroxythreonine-4-phosphate dehydrogenase PdxA [Bacteroidota bacterium]